MVSRKTLKDALSIPSRKPRSSEEMKAYLRNHSRYGEDPAHKIKVPHLNLDSDTRQRVYEMLNVEYFFELSGFEKILEDFDNRHKKEWLASVEGRSGGYIVLQSKCLLPSVGFETWERSDLEWLTGVYWDFDKTTVDALLAGITFAKTHEGTLR